MLGNYNSNRDAVQAFHLRSLAAVTDACRWGKPWLVALAAAVFLIGCAAQPRLGVTVADGEEVDPARPPIMLRGEDDQDEALRRQFWAARQVGHAPAYLDIAADALWAGNPGLASRALAWWLEDHPDDRAAIKAHALLLVDQGQEAAAVARLVDWIELAPNVESAWAELLAWLAASGNRTTARRMLDALLDATGARNAPGLHALIESRYAWRLMQPELALAWAELAVEVDAGVGSLTWLARVQTLMGRFEDAVASYSRALELATDDALLRQRKARVLTRANRLVQALDVLAAGPLTPALGLDRIELLNRLDRHDDIPEILAALEAMAAAGDPEGWLYLGLAHEALGRIEPALEAYSRVIGEPWRALGLEGRARVLMLADQPDLARRQFQHLRNRADPPERERLWEEEALALQSVREPERALDALDRALAEMPASARLREARAWLLYLDGQLQSSVRELRVAHGLKGREAEVDWALRWLQQLVQGEVGSEVDSVLLLRMALRRFATIAEADAIVLELLDAAARDPRIARFAQAFLSRALGD